ncbi:MAG: hypothetical protein M0T84_07155 [Betaproteobacteria bacterium]|nr:hypothetical protein [Betaproteobacteria bacterium]
MWDNTIEVAYQDETAQLHDVLWMLFVAVKKSHGNASEIVYPFYCIPRGGSEQMLAHLKAVVGWRRGRTGRDNPLLGRGLTDE